MERNRWEKAIRCLEVALHPNTQDDEVIAGVNGFRRTAAGTPLGDICRELADIGHAAAKSSGTRTADEHDVSADRAAEAARDALARENRDLRGKLDRERAEQEAALVRLREAERLIRALGDEIRVEQQSFADFRAASAQIVDGLKDENFDLRGALEQARVEQAAAARSRPAFAPFRHLLTATLERDGQFAPVQTTSAPLVTRHPWTA